MKSISKKDFWKKMKADIAAAKDNLKETGDLARLMSQKIDEVNAIWNDGRPPELKEADEIQPSTLIELLQPYVQKEVKGNSNWETARQTYVLHSKRWADLNTNIDTLRGEAQAIEDKMFGVQLKCVDPRSGKETTAYFDSDRSEENVRAFYLKLSDAHVEFGKSLAVLEKRIAAAIVFFNEVRKRHPELWNQPTQLN